MRPLIFALICAMVLSFARFAPAAQSAAASKPSAAVIPVFELNSELNEAPQDEVLPFGPQPVSLRELIRRMHDAADDPNVNAVVILSDHVQAGPAQIEELRQAMKSLRDKNKDVYVHSESMMMLDYVLFSGATRLSVTPTGIVLIPGLHGDGLFLRGLLDKIGVQPDFIHMGAYKSASEIFMNKEPSKEADEMMNWLFDSLYDGCTSAIADGRKTPKEKVTEWINTGLYSAEKAKEAGIIDAVEERQDFEAMLKSKYGEELTYDRKYGKKDQQQLDLSSPFAMLKIWADILGGNHKAKPTSPAVGVVYVDGMILPGKSEPSLFGSGGGGAHSSDIRKALDEAANDDAIKAVVLRVDSPGGSATASEIILDATMRVKAKKPLIVSMGDVAGSGGYYCSLGSDTIFADPMTITASIGVVGGKLVTTDMWNKVGINFHPYSRGKNADILSTDRPFSDQQRAQVEAWMNEIYGVFKKHVTDSRGDKLKKPIDELAAGRVFTGKQALDLGLIDKLGTMSDAIAYAAIQAKLEPGYDVRTVPASRNVLEKLMEDQNGGDDSDNRLVRMGQPKLSLVDLAMPYLKDLDPARVSAVTSALEKLQLLQNEQILMVMPEGHVMN